MTANHFARIMRVEMHKEKEIQAGKILVEENSPPDHFYILKRGSVGVYIGDTLIEVFNAKDSVVGEMSVILNRSRTATVKARSACTLLEYSAEQLMDIFREEPEIAYMIMRSLASRVDKANQRLSELSQQERKAQLQD